MTDKQNPSQPDSLRRRTSRPRQLTDLQDVVDRFLTSRQDVLIDRSMFRQNGDDAVQDELKVFRSVLSIVAGTTPR